MEVAAWYIKVCFETTHLTHFRFLSCIVLTCTESAFWLIFIYAAVSRHLNIYHYGFNGLCWPLCQLFSTVTSIVYPQGVLFKRPSPASIQRHWPFFNGRHSDIWQEENLSCKWMMAEFSSSASVSGSRQNRTKLSWMLIVTPAFSLQWKEKKSLLRKSFIMWNCAFLSFLKAQLSLWVSECYVSVNDWTCKMSRESGDSDK